LDNIGSSHGQLAYIYIKSKRKSGKYCTYTFFYKNNFTRTVRLKLGKSGYTENYLFRPTQQHKKQVIEKKVQQYQNTGYRD